MKRRFQTSDRALSVVALGALVVAFTFSPGAQAAERMVICEEFTSVN